MFGLFRVYLAVSGVAMIVSLVSCGEGRLGRVFWAASVALVILGGGIVHKSLAHGRRRVVIACGVTAGATLLGGGLTLAYGVQTIQDRIHTVRYLVYTHAQLRGLCSTLNKYQERYGSFPPDLGPLVTEEYVVPRELQSVFRAQPGTGGSQFAYVGGLEKFDPPEWPVIFDCADTHEDGTRVVVFLSGEARTFTGNQFEELLSNFIRAHEAAHGAAPVILDCGHVQEKLPEAGS